MASLKGKRDWLKERRKHDKKDEEEGSPERLCRIKGKGEEEERWRVGRSCA